MPSDMCLCFKVQSRVSDPAGLALGFLSRAQGLGLGAGGHLGDAEALDLNVSACPVWDTQGSDI